MRDLVAAAGWRLLASSALWLALLACGCATPSSVLRPADEAFQQGDMREAARRYQRIIDQRWLSYTELEHAVERMRQAASASVPARLRALEPLLEEAPVPELLELLSRLRVELAGQGLGVAEQRPVLEALQRVIARRAWPEVEALEKEGRYHEALERAQAWAVYLPAGEPIWAQVERLRQQAISHPERPTRPAPLLTHEVDLSVLATIILLNSTKAGTPVDAKLTRALANAAINSGLSSAEFCLRVGLTYGLQSPELVPPLPVPEVPPTPQSVQQATTPKAFTHGSSGGTALPWRSLPEEDQLAARGFISHELSGQLVTLFVPDIPGQTGKAAGMAGVRATAAPVALLGKSGSWGWRLQDQALAELFLGLRLSSAHHYLPESPGDPDPRESAFGYGGVLAYSMLYGFRGPQVGAFAGLRLQYTGYRLGDITAAGLFLPLEAWLEWRWDGRRPVLLQGWLTAIGDTGSHGLRVQVPVSPSTWVVGRYEALSLGSRMGGLYGDDRVDIGQRDATLVTLGASTVW